MYMVPVLWIVSPCYKDGDAVLQSAPVMVKKLETLCQQGIIDKKSRILLVDDGSPDDTWQVIQGICAGNSIVCSIHNEVNGGEELAYLSGLSVAVKYADVIITIDCDLQDDIDLCDDMIREFSNGYEIVYGFRNDRSTDTAIYRCFAGGYYKVMQLLGSNIVPQASQFRLISKKATEELLKMPASFPFLPAMVPELEFRSTKLPYKRNKRIAGTSTYSYKKLFTLAFNVISEYTNLLPTVHIISRDVLLLCGGAGLSRSLELAMKKKQLSRKDYLLTGAIISLFGVTEINRYFWKKKKTVGSYCLPVVDREIIK